MSYEPVVRPYSIRATNGDSGNYSRYCRPDQLTPEVVAMLERDDVLWVSVAFTDTHDYVTYTKIPRPESSS